MNRETNNEIDLLLRRMSRREDGAARKPRIDEEHLDADELSSYAQNALPAAARARYTAHLAECAMCRKLVTELSLSLGAAAVTATTTHEPAGWKKFLASLLSPMVLRYAIPALGVLVVMVVGFVYLRQQKTQLFAEVAQKRVQDTRAAAPPATSESEMPRPTPAVPSLSSESRGLHQEAQGPSERPTKPGEVESQSNAAAGAAAPAATATPAAKDQEVRKELKAEESVTVVQPQPGAAAAPAPAAPKPATDQAEEFKKTENTARKQTVDVSAAAADKETSTTRAKEPVTSLPMSRNGVANLRTLKPRSRGGEGGSSRAAEDKDDANTKAKSETESKSVAGRRFRRNGGVWTDTAYDSSKRTVNVARGSEQFRALVADEPELQKIADQLDGEIIVVWKGTAYHIR